MVEKWTQRTPPLCESSNTSILWLLKVGKPSVSLIKLSYGSLLRRFATWDYSCAMGSLVMEMVTYIVMSSFLFRYLA